MALLEQLDLVCVADRENMRVVCPQAGLHSNSLTQFSSPPATIQAPDLGRVFAVAALGDLVYAVNGPTSPMIPVRGFTIDPRSETIIDHWEPSTMVINVYFITDNIESYNNLSIFFIYRLLPIRTQ